MFSDFFKKHITIIFLIHQYRRPPELLAYKVYATLMKILSDFSLEPDFLS